MCARSKLTCRTAAALACLAWLSIANALPGFDYDPGIDAEPVPVFEYYQAEYDLYFITASAAEVRAIDGGAFPGWHRVDAGPAFSVFTSPVRMFTGSTWVAARPACRYFVPPASHFFSLDAAECDAVGTSYPDFVLETRTAFYAWSPDATGTCPQPQGLALPRLAPAYRLWNGRLLTNHRLTTSAAQREAMTAAGWISEGTGPLGVAMCVPATR